MKWTTKYKNGLQHVKQSVKSTHLNVVQSSTATVLCSYCSILTSTASAKQTHGASARLNQVNQDKTMHCSWGNCEEPYRAGSISSGEPLMGQNPTDTLQPGRQQKKTSSAMTWPMLSARNGKSHQQPPFTPWLMALNQRNKAILLSKAGIPKF